VLCVEEVESRGGSFEKGTKEKKIFFDGTKKFAFCGRRRKNENIN
jgi:hypothetical protein